VERTPPSTWEVEKFRPQRITGSPLYAFRYNSYYDYEAKGFPHFRQPDNPLVVKASISEGHLGEGWVGIPVKPGVYEDTVVILMDLHAQMDMTEIVRKLEEELQR
jgi:hypothetical protein